MKTISQVKSKLGTGGVAMNILRLAANVVNGEQIVIGRDTFEIDIINTDLTKNTVEALNATDTETAITISAHGLLVGNLIRVENEIMRIKKLDGVNSVIVSRGSAGTTKATHVTNSDIYVSDAAPTGGVIPIGLVTTLTPTAASAAIVAAINNMSSHGLIAAAISVNEISIKTGGGRLPELLACTETLTGSGNAWTASAMYGAIDAGVSGVALASRAAVAQDVTLDHMVFDFAFTPVSWMVQIRTAAGALKTWDGVATLSGNRVTVTNGGSSDWAATDIVTVLAAE